MKYQLLAVLAAAVACQAHPKPEQNASTAPPSTAPQAVAESRPIVSTREQADIGDDLADLLREVAQEQHAEGAPWPIAISVGDFPPSKRIVLVWEDGVITGPMDRESAKALRGKPRSPGGDG
jgi:hypothetical protein